MPGFDRTIDNRWRPDLESSWKRVDEERREPTVMSRELSFVPTRYSTPEAHDPQTKALISRLAALERLPHGAAVSKLLDEWTWTNKMKCWDERQRFLEPLIAAAQRDPEQNEHVVIFLMLVFEPVRRSVSKAFTEIHHGIVPRTRDINWSNRAEARMLNRIAREELFDVTREAALEALFRFPQPPPKAIFPWLRETIAHRALDKLHGTLPEIETDGLAAEEAAAVQQALLGFEAFEAPATNSRPGMRAWRSKVEMRDVFGVVEEFFGYDAVRGVCRQAIGRLPSRQAEVIDGYFFRETDVPALAEERGVSESTVYNQKATAQKTLLEDDVFFSALRDLGRVRDRARAECLAQRYPSGRLPDGRRIVCIDDAA